MPNSLSIRSYILQEMAVPNTYGLETTILNIFKKGLANLDKQYRDIKKDQDSIEILERFSWKNPKLKLSPKAKQQYEKEMLDNNMSVVLAGVDLKTTNPDFFNLAQQLNRPATIILSIRLVSSNSLNLFTFSTPNILAIPLVNSTIPKDTSLTQFIQTSLGENPLAPSLIAHELTHFLDNRPLTHVYNHGGDLGIYYKYPLEALATAREVVDMLPPKDKYNKTNLLPNLYAVLKPSRLQYLFVNLPKFTELIDNVIDTLIAQDRWEGSTPFAHKVRSITRPPIRAIQRLYYRLTGQID